MKKKKRLKTALLAIVIILFLAAIPISVFCVEKNENKIKTNKTATEYYNEMVAVKIDGINYVPRPSVKSWLIIGVDAEGKIVSNGAYNNSQQADFLSLIILDEKANKYSVLHINRDTMTDIPIIGVMGQNAGTAVGQIALAHTYGDGTYLSCQNQLQAVRNYLFGANIYGYVSMNMDAISIINDLVGGVNITIPEDMTSVDREFYSGNDLNLSGEQALKFVRARINTGDGTNLSRMERQRIYIEAFIKKIESLDINEKFICDLSENVSDYIISDNIEEAINLFSHLSNYQCSGIFDIKGETVVGKNGFIEFYADEADLKSKIINLLLK